MALIEISDLHVDFRLGRSVVHGLRGVDLAIEEGSRTAIVGESGSGKTISGIALLGLLPDNARVVRGSVRFDGRDVLTLDEKSLQALRGRSLCMIFQNALQSFNPLYPVGRQIADVYRRHTGAGEREAMDRAVAVLEATGIADAPVRAGNYPHEYSGGMAQRAMIAMALMCEPRVLIADEPTSGLDVTIQTQVLDLIDRVASETGTTLLFITHDIGQVSRVCDRVVVMYAGAVMEIGTVTEVFSGAANPYTRMLLACSIALSGDTMPTIPGRVPDVRSTWRGCSFADRCPRAEAICRSTRPPLLAVSEGHLSACHFARDVHAANS